MGKAEIQAKVEFEKVIAEANEGAYQPVRFTRIKYKASDTCHIDIRKFQRGYNEDGEDKFHPTKSGVRFPEREFIKVLKAYTLLPEQFLHKDILKESVPLLQSSEYESAILKAFKIIEMTIREKIKADPEDVGIKLIRKAFHPENGELSNYNIPKSEREAFANYIAGAFGFYRNSSSHRNVEFTYVSAFEKLVVASDLLKIVDQSPDYVPF